MVVAVGPLQQVDAQVDRRPHAEVVGQLGDQLADRCLQVPRQGQFGHLRSMSPPTVSPVTWTPYADLDELLDELLGPLAADPR